MWFDALDLRELLGDEVVERKQSGYELDGLAGEVQATLEDPGAPLAKVQQLYDELDHTRLRSDWAYEEPSQLEEIGAASPGAADHDQPPAGTLRDRVHAAWLGRCAGCNLGKPVEGGWGRGTKGYSSSSLFSGVFRRRVESWSLPLRSAERLRP